MAFPSNSHAEGALVFRILTTIKLKNTNFIHQLSFVYAINNTNQHLTHHKKKKRKTKASIFEMTLCGLVFLVKKINCFATARFLNK